MEENKIKETIKNEKVTKLILAIGGAYIIGCIVGTANANKNNCNSYKNGFIDGVNNIMSAIKN